MPQNFRSLRSAWFACVVSLVAAQALGQSARVPVPAATGPLPVSAQSYPFAAADHAMTPFDLAGAGYVEEEFLITGRASVYDWAADRTIKVITAVHDADPRPAPARRPRFQRRRLRRADVHGAPLGLADDVGLPARRLDRAGRCVGWRDDAGVGGGPQTIQRAAVCVARVSESGAR
jgi:hypothetical protein